MWRLLIAFLLGLASFLLLMFVGETAGLTAAGAALMVYFSVCQFLLSWGEVDAHRNWRLMLTLDAVELLSVAIMVVVEKWPVILSQGPVILFGTCGGTYLGGLLASMMARRRRRDAIEEA